MKRRIVILAEKNFGPITSKMANAAIRYLSDEIVAVVDSSRAGRTAQEVLNFGGDIPVISSIDESFRLEPTTLLIGISPPGGEFPSDWYPMIIKAIQNKLDIISGLHEFLQDIAEFRVLADKYNVKIIDLRKYDQKETLARGVARNFRSKIILTVGSHGNVGKMTATIEIVKALQQLGKSADWFATGQIGILLKGKGVPLDTIKGDFISGTLEAALARVDGNFEYLFVEGQGSLQHLGYSPVALGVMHGCLPDAMIGCVRTDVGISDYGVDTQDLKTMIRVNEEMLSFVKPAKVVGISLNTYHLSEEKAKAAIAEAQNRTGLPATDPVRFGAEPLADSLTSFFESYRKHS